MSGKEEPEEIKEEKIIEERKKKLKNLFIQKNYWVIIFLALAVILGVYIRSLPMQDHGGKPGLWDITTNDWTLGPDLDPWLFTRYASEMINHTFSRIDMMRNVPLGFDTTTELQMVPYMIFLTYKLVNIFGSYSVNFAAALMPVLLFALTIISFFLFVREIFSRKNSPDRNLHANIVASISTLLMIVIPVFLSRTIAGIPEKESVGFFFMFLAFYLFLKAWKSERIKIAIILGCLAGISTALMGLAWGGVSYIYVTIGIAGMAAFVLGKFNKKEALVYSSWWAVSLVITLLFTNKFSLKGFFTSLDTGMAFLVLFIVLVDLLTWKTKISKAKFLQEMKMPKNIFSLIIAIILGLVLLTIISGPSIIIEKAQAINQLMFQPVTGRWSQTVAENRQPYFTEWGASFGPFIKGIPIMFWLFFIGSAVLFRQMMSHLRKKDAWILTFFYIIFFFGLVFSRYAAHPALMDGEGFASRLFYYGSAILLIGSIVYYYNQYHKERIEGFEKIEFEFIFLFALFVLCLFTARSAVRLIMVLGPVAPIFIAYLVVFSVDKFRKNKDETGKMLFGIFSLILVLLVVFSFWNFYNQVKSEAYGYVPNYYTQQWQKAMSWVRSETPSNSVFAHWWDYGYWIQSIGNRATVTDGGNAIVWWNYLTGRLVLTGDNQQDALNFLYNHNASYLLIDSSDIGKYGAYSSIGSNENYDRASWIPIMASDSNQIQETKEGVTRVYQGGSGIDEDIIYNLNSSKIFLPSGSAAIIGILIETSQVSNLTAIKQPEAVFYYQGKQIKIPLRYAEYNSQFFDFKDGLEAAAKIIPRVYQASQGVQIDQQGAVVYISPRVLRGMMAQIYLLNDPFKKFQNFHLVHSEQNLIVDSLKSQGAVSNDFIMYGDVQGPIKIWKIQYTGTEKSNPEYIDTDSTKYLSWQL